MIISTIIIFSKNKELFQNSIVFTIRDNDDILPDLTNTNIGKLINIDRYSIHQKG